MEPHEKSRLAATWAAMGEYYRSPLSDAVLRFYVADLEDLPLHSVLRAMTRLRLEPKRRLCPLPADVRQAIDGQGDSAEELAARIISAMGRIGYTQPELARERLGPVAWEVVDDMGGWVQLCTTLRTDQVQTFRAQARELARTKLQRDGVGGFTGPCLTGVANPERRQVRGRVGDR